MIRGLVIVLIALLAALWFIAVFPVNSVATSSFLLGAGCMALIWFTALVGRR